MLIFSIQVKIQGTNYIGKNESRKRKENKDKVSLLLMSITYRDLVLSQ